MNFMTKDIDLNGEFADRKGSLNGAEAAQGAIPTGGFDFDALRLSQAYEQTAGVEKLLTTVPVRKPNKTEFVRVHPEMHFDTMLLELKEDRESYLVLPHILTEVSGIAVPVSLRAGRQPRRCPLPVASSPSWRGWAQQCLARERPRSGGPRRSPMGLHPGQHVSRSL